MLYAGARAELLPRQPYLSQCCGKCCFVPHYASLGLTPLVCYRLGPTVNFIFVDCTVVLSGCEQALVQ